MHIRINMSAGRLGLREHPILRREMRALMRNRRVPWMLFASAGLAVGCGVLLLVLGLRHGASFTDEEYARLGYNLFRWMMVLEVLFILVLTPALTGGAIARECHRQSMEALLLSRLSLRHIITDKLLAALALEGIAMLCALPVVAVAFIFGGVSPWEILSMQALLFVVAACCGATGIYWSALCRNDIIAIALTYLTTLAWIIFTIPLFILPLLFRLFMIIRQALQRANNGITPMLAVMAYLFGIPLLVILTYWRSMMWFLAIVNLVTPFSMFYFDSDQADDLLDILVLSLSAVLLLVSTRFMLAAAERAIRHRWPGGAFP